MTDILQIITNYEQTKFQSLYDDKRQFNAKISFGDFCSIIKNLSQISPLVVQPFIENIKKEIKTKTNVDNESGMMVSQTDYFRYIHLLIIENNRFLNQSDPELFELFKLLTGEKETINKKRLMEILTTFDIPIDYNTFFAYVDKKEEELAFVDFCSLFKPIEQTELFIKTFSKSFNITEKKSMNVFPISISKRA